MKKTLNKNTLKYIICGSISLLVIIIDFITKILAVTCLEENKPIKVLGEFLKLDLTFNEGVAFGLGDFGNPAIWGVLSLVMSGVIGFMIYKVGDIKTKPVGTIALSLMLGGALGNMVDRFFNFPASIYGGFGVVDFVNTNHIVELLSGGRFTWGVWNIADSMLCVGTAVLAVHILFFEKDDKKQTNEQQDGIIEVEAEVVTVEEPSSGEQND